MLRENYCVTYEDEDVPEEEREEEHQGVQTRSIIKRKKEVLAPGIARRFDEVNNLMKF